MDNDARALLTSQRDWLTAIRHDAEQRLAAVEHRTNMEGRMLPDSASRAARVVRQIICAIDERCSQIAQLLATDDTVSNKEAAALSKQPLSLVPNVHFSLLTDKKHPDIVLVDLPDTLNRTLLAIGPAAVPRKQLWK